MKLSLASLLALAALGSVLADPNTCEKEAQLVNQEMVGQKYTETVSDTIRVLHPGDMTTMEYNSSRLNIHVDENDVILSASCA